MSDNIRVGIVGYGNLGRGVELALGHNPDMELVAVFTRRNPADVQTVGGDVPVYGLDVINDFRERLDVLILCGGSKSDLPEQTPALAKTFNTVDSFDTHSDIPRYFAEVNEAATQSGHTAIISVGWDPGLFSLLRLYGESVLPNGQTYTFWGKGLSQGHSDAIRRVDGVKAGVQYTVPSTEAIDRVRSGSQPELSTRDKHQRECYIVLDDGADEQRVRDEIVSMPAYFADYDTSVHVISEEELARDHAAMPHGGFVLRSGSTSPEHNQVIEFSLQLDSNPEFTSSVLVAYARAAARLAAQGGHGAYSVYDIAPGLLSPKSADQLRAEML